MKPLQGKRIVITRPPHKAGELAERLRELGAEPLVVPTIAIESPKNLDALKAALQNTYNWVIFTSGNAVEQVFNFPLNTQKIAAVGTATAKAIESHGSCVDLIPTIHTAEALYETMAAQFELQGMKILLPQGDLAKPTLAESLRQAGADVQTVIAYRTVRPTIQVDFSQPIDAITFTSASTVHHFMAWFDEIGESRIVCIGTVTAEAVREYGLSVHAIAEPHTLEGLIRALCRLFEQSENTGKIKEGGLRARQ